MTFSVLSKLFYNSKDERYVNALYLDRMPDASSELNKILKYVKFPRVSPFNQETTCSFAIMNPDNPSSYAEIRDIPLIFTWLRHHGFTIDTTVSHGNICFIYSNSEN